MIPPTRCVAVALPLAIAAACAVPTEPDAAGPDVRGTWSYTATQGAPSATLMGTLIVSEQEGSSFSGRLDVRETDAAGIQRARSGGASGRALDAETLDFDAFLGASPRRHIGRIHADTLSGTWVEPAPTGVLTGGFRAVRTGPS